MERKFNTECSKRAHIIFEKVAVRNDKLQKYTVFVKTASNT